MAKQNAVDSLKESIRLLEIRQAEEGKILKDQLKITYESLKPVNLIKNSIKELTSSVEIKNNLFESVVTILTGYATKRLMVNSKSSVFVKTLGAIMQFGLTRLIANNAETIRIYLFNLIDKFFKPGEVKVSGPEV